MNVGYLLPAAAFLAGAAVILTRAGYGAFGDRSRRGQPCTASPCVHNASILALLGALLLKRGPSTDKRTIWNLESPRQQNAPCRWREWLERRK
jgi:hypothetical protein